MIDIQMTHFFDIFLEIILVFALSAFIGLEREALKFKKAEVGIRTFSLIGLFGYFSVVLQKSLNVPITLVSLLGILTLVGVSYYVSSKKGFSGITTELSIFLTYFIGMLVGIQVYWSAIVLSIITTAILVSKRFLREFSKSVNEEDILATIKFLIVSVIIYPLLPNNYIDPWNLFNPANVWFIIVMVSAVSFAGFVTVKIYGEKRGLKLTGFFGGLANSEVTVASIAQRSKYLKGRFGRLLDNFISAASLANSSMIFRNFLISIISGGLAIAKGIFIPIFVLLSVNLLFGIGTFGKRQKVKHSLKLKTPFAIVPALKFGLIFLVLSVLVYFAKNYLGGYGMVVVVIFGSLVSSGAVVASISSSFASGSIALRTAVNMIILACIISSINKLLISRAMGSKEFFREMIKPIVTVSVVGILILAIKIFLF